ncbi:MAG TPA: type II toxin-antitoxin system prevent-host-death family antitoxin [Geobacter sp.]|nr:type II toxin-antitoxin system prevent-host-death family antitoxin [Geobacter sp.]
MTVVKMHEAKTQLSRLVEEVNGGGEVVIARGNMRIAKLVPYTTTKRARKPGYLKGKIKIAADFDAPLPEEIVDGFGA